MRIALLGKFPPIQGGVSSATYWTAVELAKRGHTVHVISNGSEVEAGFRCFLVGEDHLRLSMQDGLGRLTVHQSTPLQRFSYVPWAAPYCSQLFGLGLSVIEREQCEVILGWYFEPYGLVASLLGTTLGRPYVLRHAGSDIGRLANHPDLANSYGWMVSNANAVLTSGRSSDAHKRLIALGVKQAQLRYLYPTQLPPDFLQACPPMDVESLVDRLSKWYPLLPCTTSVVQSVAKLNEKPFNPRLPTVGVYGKVGEVKGSFDLVSALAQLAFEGLQFNFLTIAGGTPGSLGKYYAAILERPELCKRTWILPLIAPWRIPAFLRTCEIVCFLERDFPITFHAPTVPREVLSSGACLVLSAEVAEKQPFSESLSDDKNYIRIEDPKNHEELTLRLRSLLNAPEKTRIIGKHGLFLSETCERFFGPISALASSLEEIFVGTAR